MKRFILSLLMIVVIFPFSGILGPAHATDVAQLDAVPNASGVNLPQTPTKMALPVTWTDAEVSAGVAISHPVPTGDNAPRYVLITATDNVYVNFNGTAAVPTTTVSDGTASVLNPGLTILKGGVRYISVIAPTGTVITYQFLK